MDGIFFSELEPPLLVKPIDDEDKGDDDDEDDDDDAVSCTWESL